MKSKNKFIFIADLETTGFSPVTNDIIELACIVAKKINGEYVKINSFCDRCSPVNEKSWTFGAEKIHKIPRHVAFGYQEPRKMLIKLLHFLKMFKHHDNEPLLFVYHGKNKFDFKFLDQAFFKAGLKSSFEKVFNTDYIESTCEIARKYQSALGLDNSKLNTLCDHFGIELDHHKALSDTNATFELYKKLKKMGYQTELKI